MLVYYLNLLLILALAWPLCIYRPSRPKRALYLLCTFAYMFFLAAARQGIGNDYFSYIDRYYACAGSSWGALLQENGLEIGYPLLCKLISLTGASQTAMYALMSLGCLIPVAVFIYRYSENAWLSTWLYVTLTFYYGTMNFVRQNLALSVLLLGYPLLRRRQWRPMLGYAAIVLLAASIHKSALIMLPALLVCLLPLNRLIGGAYGAAALLLYLCSDWLVDWVTSHVYTYYKGSIYLTYGLSPVFLIIPAFILLLVLWQKKRLQQCYTDAPLIINLVFYSVLIWLFITKHMILERFSLYFYIYALLLIPMAVELQRPSGQLERQVRESREKARQTGKKSAQRRLGELSAQLSRSRALYYGLIGAVLLATFCYNEFGMHDGSNGFHGVFPYHSLIEALNRLP